MYLQGSTLTFEPGSYVWQVNIFQVVLLEAQIAHIFTGMYRLVHERHFSHGQFNINQNSVS